MLGIFAEAVGVSVRKHVRAVMVRDDAMFAARIARQTRVSMRIEIPRDDPIADGKAGVFPNLSSNGRPGAQDVGNTFSQGRVVAARNRETRISGELLDLCFDFFARKGTGLDNGVLHRS